MSMEAIEKVTQAEIEVRERKAAAEAEAKRMVVDAEREGLALLQQVRADAAENGKAMLREAEEKAAKQAETILQDGAPAQNLSQKLGREATLSEIEQDTGIVMEDIVMALEANVEVESIYKSVYQSDGSEIFLVDQVAGMAGGGLGRMGNSGYDNSGGHHYGGACEDYEKEKVLNSILLNQVMDSLEGVERELIYLRYFQDKTQTEVAKRMGVSQVQVSRMEKKILVRLRKTFA